MVISVCIFWFLLCFSFLIATLFSSNAGIDYPYMHLDVVSQTWQPLNLMDFMLEWGLLAVVFYLNISALTYLVSFMVKDEGILFLIVSCLMIGMFFLPNIMDDVKTLAHCLPSTYMGYIGVTDGSVAMQYMNTDISFTVGIQYLVSYLLLELSFCFILKFKQL